MLVHGEMKASMRVLAAVGLALLSGACRRESEGARGTKAAVSAGAPIGECGHAVCADNFFIDTSSTPGCAPGATCAVSVRLVATGVFHINDEYPYRFKADDAKDLQYLGTDGTGNGVFSKAAGDWAKMDPKSGAMTVKFASARAGRKTVEGTLRLSVCSEANCLLEQRQVAVPVEVN
jgi:hypothetical protein